MKRPEVFAPAGRMTVAELDAAREGFERCVGIPLKADIADRQSGRFAGTEKERAQEFSDKYLDNESDILISLKGGYGCSQVIPHLPLRQLRTAKRKIICGYSDITILAAVAHCEFGADFLHGPMVSDFTNGQKNILGKQALQDFLQSSEEVCYWPANVELAPIRYGEVSGKLVGGNLSLLCSILGTRWQKVFDGAILVFEEFFEYLFRVDRMFQHLKMAGVFDQVNGIVIGGMTEMQDSNIPYGANVRDITLEALKGFQGPVAWGAPFGHGDNNMPISLYRRATLRVSHSQVEVIHHDA